MVLPNSKTGAVNFGGWVSNVEMSESNCRMISSTVVSGIGIVCRMKVRVSASISVLV